MEGREGYLRRCATRHRDHNLLIFEALRTIGMRIRYHGGARELSRTLVVYESIIR